MYKIEATSHMFNDKKMLDQHRFVKDLLKDEFATLHGITLSTHKKQWYFFPSRFPFLPAQVMLEYNLCVPRPAPWMPWSFQTLIVIVNDFWISNSVFQVKHKHNSDACYKR